MLVEKPLEDYRRRLPVDQFSISAGFDALKSQCTNGRDCRHTFVFINDRQSGLSGKFACKRPHSLALRSIAAVHVERQSDNDLHRPMPATDLLDDIYIRLHILAGDSFQSGRSDTKRI